MSDISKPKQHDNLQTFTSVSYIPRSPIDALKNPYWNKAMKEELQALIGNNTRELLSRNHDMNIVRSMWILSS